MKCLENAREKIGINLNSAATFADFEVVQGNANDMSIFLDDRFEVLPLVVLHLLQFFGGRHVWGSDTSQLGRPAEVLGEALRAILQ